VYVYSCVSSLSLEEGVLTSPLGPDKEIPDVGFAVTLFDGLEGHEDSTALVGGGRHSYGIHTTKALGKTRIQRQIGSRFNALRPTQQNICGSHGLFIVPY